MAQRGCEKIGASLGKYALNGNYCSILGLYGDNGK